jgi:peptide methionine sulfoxide reductase msrA/msrB
VKTPIFRLLFGLPFLVMSQPLEAKPKLETATFAGGCFWCMTPPYESLPGVVTVLAGYTDGKGDSANYDNYMDRGFTEGVQVTFDPAKVTYEKLVEVFWQNIDPTDPNGQFADRGPGYRAAVYYHDDKQKKIAEKSKTDLGKSGRFDKPILTPILPYKNFFAAEDYHQGYSKKNPVRYQMYKAGSGRKGFLEGVWGKKSH